MVAAHNKHHHMISDLKTLKASMQPLMLQTWKHLNSFLSPMRILATNLLNYNRPSNSKPTSICKSNSN